MTGPEINVTPPPVVVPDEIEREQQVTESPPQRQEGVAGAQQPAPAATRPEQPADAPTDADFFERVVLPSAETSFAAAIPPERIPPPPPLDHERYLSDPDYAKNYMAAVALYNQAVAEARQKQVEARMAKVELLGMADRINKAFAEGVSPFLDYFETQEEKAEIIRAVATAKEVALKIGDVSSLADPSYWASVAASAAARSGALFRARSMSRPEPRPFRTTAPQPTGTQYQLTDEERALARQFGLTEEEWIRNLQEGT